MPYHLLEIALWAITCLCFIATIYPYLIYPAILRIAPSKPIAYEQLSAGRGHEFALLFCAYNEEVGLVDKLRNIRDLRNAFPELEVLAYDDCSTDRTVQMLESSGLGIRVVHGGQRMGKAHGMKLLASLTEREFLVFTDANVVLQVEAIDELRSYYADPQVGGVCGLLKYVDANRSPVAHAGGLYWRLEERIKSAESHTGNVMGADGSIFSIRHELYPEFPDTVLDDLTVSMAVIFKRFRLIKASSVVAEEKLVVSRSDDFRRRLRISTRAYHTHLWMRREVATLSLGDRWRYWSHRQMRWLGAYFLTAGSLSGIAAVYSSVSLVAAISVAAGTASLVALGLFWPLGRITAFVHVVSSVMLTGVGVMRALQGHTVTTWRPPTR